MTPLVQRELKDDWMKSYRSQTDFTSVFFFKHAALVKATRVVWIQDPTSTTCPTQTNHRHKQLNGGSGLERGEPEALERCWERSIWTRSHAVQQNWCWSIQTSLLTVWVENLSELILTGKTVTESSLLDTDWKNNGPSTNQSPFKKRII